MIKSVSKLGFPFFLIIFFIWIIACNQPSSSEPKDTIKVEDMLERKVTIPDSVTRVVGIGPGALRLLVYLQVTDFVVGVEDIEKRKGRPYSYAYPNLAEKPTIGPAFTGDPELITARNRMLFL